MAVVRTVNLNDLTPRELAELFCDMRSDDQAEFFNQVGEIAKEWSSAGWCVQACAILHEPALKDIGRAVITKLGEHAGTEEPSPSPTTSRR